MLLPKKAQAVLRGHNCPSYAPHSRHHVVVAGVVQQCRSLQRPRCLSHPPQIDSHSSSESFFVWSFSHFFTSATNFPVAVSIRLFGNTLHGTKNERPSSLAIFCSDPSSYIFLFSFHSLALALCPEVVCNICYCCHHPFRRATRKKMENCTHTENLFCLAPSVPVT